MYNISIFGDFTGESLNVKESLNDEELHKYLFLFHCNNGVQWHNTMIVGGWRWQSMQIQIIAEQGYFLGIIQVMQVAHTMFCFMMVFEVDSHDYLRGKLIVQEE